MATNHFEGRVVVLTGAGGGLGSALARQLIQQGAHLILSSRQPHKLEQAAAEAMAGGGPGRIIKLVPADLSSDAGCAELHRACEELPHPVDMLINNAGVASYGPLHSVPQHAWEQMVQINLLAPLRLTTRFLPTMIARKSGHIVLISSIFGQRGLPGVSVYASTKFGLRGLGEALAEDLHRTGVEVSVVYPSFTRTEMLHAAPRYGGTHVHVPNWLVDEAEPVVQRILGDLAQRRRHIYPSWRAQAYALAGRFIPGVLPHLARWVTR
ncbi:SDR family NAD(P)-dependent oxidoreductase [Candidatus Oscillochloris fontis]|uniref:SDR family NAD(P)-dependent oxidoreductase n=1 Tax=Candidatus Oscillochloris fontis TaxID=2496868 RepID=UPI00101D8C44|nr:SDR family NAD(P)-dependent oxidoreductase [Candidatus Oscillochloris fontis]